MYKAHQMRENSLPDMARSLKLPSTIRSIFLGSFGGTLGLFLITLKLDVLYYSLAFLGLYLFMYVYIDYVNSPWRAWYIERRKEEMRHEAE